MDEFVKRLYDFISIYRIFWSQNSHYRYFIDIYRYFTDMIFTDILPIFDRYLLIFYRYFFRNSSTSARALQSRFFDEKSMILPIFPLLFLLNADHKPIF